MQECRRKLRLRTIWGQLGLSQKDDSSAVSYVLNYVYEEDNGPILLLDLQQCGVMLAALVLPGARGRLDGRRADGAEHQG